MNLFKRILPDIVVVILFAVLSFVYFFPAVTEGRILSQHDSVAGIGAGEEAKEYLERTGERTRWTNSIFGGMPTYQMSPSYDSTDTLKVVEKLYHLYLPDYVWYVFVMLLGFYILLRAFDFSIWLASLGAVIWAFSSYFFIIIAAGHIWKFVTLAYIPPTIAGMVLAYRGKYLPGGLLTAVFVALQIVSNHVQMSYYFLFVMLFMAVAFGVDAWRKKEMPQFLKATGVLLMAGILGVCINLSNLYHTYEYSKETMRGKSELVKPDSHNQTKSGLERDYITQWSYGIGETFSLLVPNVKGGASVPLAANEKAMEKANPMYNSIYSQIGQYWGEQPGTSGPVYVGAFVMFLFILGLFIVKGPMKWALLAATVLSVLLSWGKNFMGFTDFFLDYIPMYDKFRAVSSILVIAEFTIPLLAVLALKEVMARPQLMKEQARSFYISLGLTGGIALLFALAPGFFFPSYVSSAEMQALQGIPADQLAPLLANLEEIRQHIFTSDAWRSFFIIIIGAAVLWGYGMGKLKAQATILALAVLCLADMWSVNKRYLYDEQFVEKVQQDNSFKPTETDKAILADKTLDFRVLNLAGNTFNENTTSYWHKSIGGYHAAKLRRYQEMIEEHISTEMNDVFKAVSEAGGDMRKVDPSGFPVLNMLNTRYFIFPLQGGKTVPMQNPYTLGNAWFVNEVQYVDNANEEIDALHRIDPARTAVVDKKFRAEVGPAAETDTLGSIKLTAYEPNDLKYETNSQTGGTVVFSEIYYPGWQAYIDGVEVSHGRADYILRAMNVPAGKHVVEFKFDPKSLHVTETVAFVALGVLACVLVLFFFLQVRKARRKMD
ncbi:YfhO family protein [Phocaeicola sartorii]|uniref:YfhO family protein n=1 Tax=Phocaeicola sartorii TaxID=671267 RepID=UPI001F5994DE|nr:YfhO family protein [Phocaeicola sartorii]